MKQVSIIIPTFNSEKTIHRLLDAFEKDQINCDYEIIVIDGCSKDKTVEICKQYDVKLYSNPKVHAAAARNIGIENSQGTICAFIDSDCVPCAGWTDMICDLFKDDSIMAIGGKMIPYPPKNRIEDFAGKLYIKRVCFSNKRIETFSRQTKLPKHAFVTANCAYRRVFLQELGGFDEFFTNNGEDLDLFWRAIDSKKGKLIYEPSIVVQHSFVDTIKKLFMKYRQYGLAYAKLAFRYNKKFQIDWFYYIKMLFIFLTVPFRPITNFLSIIYMLGFVWGKLIGSIRYRIINL